MKNMYRVNNAASVITHYAATGLLAVGTLALASPWAIGAAVLITGGLNVFMIKRQKELMENDLVVHPDIHEHSPRLGEMVKELYQRTGIDSASYPVYDFRTARLSRNQTKGPINEVLREVFNKMASTHNAAAFNLGKPRIMISEPLMKLLDDKEEYAVLAHEFTHVAAYHQHTSLPRNLLSGIARTANGLTVMIAALSTGLLTFCGAIVASALTKKIVDSVTDNPARHKKSSELSLPEKARSKKIGEISTNISTVLNVGLFTFMNPAYLGLFAASRVMNIGHKYIGGSFSRSNEYQADRGAVELGADPLALITALRKITQVNKDSLNKAYDGNPPQKSALRKSWDQLFTTHPALERRIDHLADLALARGFSENAIADARTKPINIPVTDHIPRHVIEQMMRAS